MIALADGAGGTGNGAIAAEAIIDAIGTAASGVDWSMLLADLDRDVKRLGGGQSTLVASDGLLRYAKRSDIARVANGPDLAVAARALVDLVRLPTGGLQDDVSIVLCRQLR